MFLPCCKSRNWEVWDLAILWSCPRTTIDSQLNHKFLQINLCILTISCLAMGLTASNCCNNLLDKTVSPSCIFGLTPICWRICPVEAWTQSPTCHHRAEKFVKELLRALLQCHCIDSNFKNGKTWPNDKKETSFVVPAFWSCVQLLAFNACH